MMHSYDLLCRFACLFFCGGGGQWVGAITFTKNEIFTSCTNEMDILWYNLYKSRLDLKNVFVGYSETCLF